MVWLGLRWEMTADTPAAPLFAGEHKDRGQALAGTETPAPISSPSTRGVAPTPASAALSVQRLAPDAFPGPDLVSATGKAPVGLECVRTNTSPSCSDG